ncbi:hypothetical protein [Frankia sp. Cr2]|uniref:AMIN-like domain-containing (lipo)protein n=1 Tax=Frankia sp. Cr2 TaxID=3073932 RepID=UPI002AD1D83B|nr:hypothetical protein [Frankia sp. Cr2]
MRPFSALAAVCTATVIGLGVLPAEAASPPKISPKISVRIPTVVGYTSQHAASARVDTIGFRFKGGLPGTFSARYIPRSQVRNEPSDLRIFIPGKSWVLVQFTPAMAHNDQGKVTAPVRFRPENTTNVIIAQRTEDFEGHVSYIIGLRQKQPPAPVHPTIFADGSKILVNIPTK